MRTSLGADQRSSMLHQSGTQLTDSVLPESADQEASTGSPHLWLPPSDQPALAWSRLTLSRFQVLFLVSFFASDR